MAGRMTRRQCSRDAFSASVAVQSYLQMIESSIRQAANQLTDHACLRCRSAVNAVAKVRELGVGFGKPVCSFAASTKSNPLIAKPDTVCRPSRARAGQRYQ